MVEFYKAGKRNRSIFAAFIEGRTINELAAQYNLTPTTIRAILNSERHRIAVSSDPEYCKLREKFEPGIWMRAHKRTLDS